MGGFSEVDPTLGMSATETQIYAEINALAQKEYATLYGSDPIGSTQVKLQQQVVAGMNYKLTYISQSGKTVIIYIHRDLQGYYFIKSIEIKEKEKGKGN